MAITKGFKHLTRRISKSWKGLSITFAASVTILGQSYTWVVDY